MTRTESAGRLLFLLLLFAGISLDLRGQLDSSTDPAKTAQARSQAEFDKYLEIVANVDPRQRVSRVNEFAAQFPKSDLLPPAYQYQMHAFEQLNDFDGMLLAGRQALRGNPDDVNTMLALAPAMADRASGRPDQEELLSQAEGYAKRALELLEAIRIPHNLSIEQWDHEKRQMQSKAHGVLGTVALQRKHGQDAVSEYKICIALDPDPQGVNFLRLGLALVSIRAKSDAASSFRRAVELGPDSVRSLAMEELGTASKQPVVR